METPKNQPVSGPAARLHRLLSHWKNLLKLGGVIDVIDHLGSRMIFQAYEKWISQQECWYLLVIPSFWWVVEQLEDYASGMRPPILFW